MSNLKQRLLSWMHGHVFAGDLIITLVIGVLLFGVTGGITYNPGLLFDLKPSTQMAWEAAMLRASSAAAAATDAATAGPETE